MSTFLPPCAARCAPGRKSCVNTAIALPVSPLQLFTANISTLARPVARRHWRILHGRALGVTPASTRRPMHGSARAPCATLSSTSPALGATLCLERGFIAAHTESSSSTTVVLLMRRVLRAVGEHSNPLTSPWRGRASQRKARTPCSGDEGPQTRELVSRPCRSQLRHWRPISPSASHNCATSRRAQRGGDGSPSGAWPRSG